MFYIKVIDGQPIDHPVTYQNLMDVFGTIPDNYESFSRASRPVPTVYTVVDVNALPTYKKVDGVWTEEFPVYELTPEEIAAKQQAVKDKWNSRPNDAIQNFSAWVFDENLCKYVPPIPFPEGAPLRNLYWCGQTNNWETYPEKPNDGKQYSFVYATRSWEVVT